MKRRRYTSKFNRETTWMMIIEGLSAREVSEQLGVSENMLYRWKQEHIKELEDTKPMEAQSPTEMAKEI